MFVRNELPLVLSQLRLCSCNVLVRIRLFAVHRVQALHIRLELGCIRASIPSKNVAGKYDESPKRQEAAVVYAQRQSIDRRNGEQIDGDKSDRETHGVDDEA